MDITSEWEKVVLAELDATTIFASCKYFFTGGLDFDARVQRAFSKVGNLETIQYMASRIPNFDYQKCFYDSISERENMDIVRWLVPFLQQTELEYLLESRIGWYDGPFTKELKMEIQWILGLGAQDFKSAFQPTIYFYSKDNQEIWRWLVEMEYLSHQEFQDILDEI
jgi:hypothetical protein